MNENKKAKKVVALLLCAVLLVVGSVSATVAYLTDSDAVTNSFTVGKVEIDLNEAKVTEYGVKDGDTRVNANTYKLIPGHTYVKDPTVTVKANSEECWLFVEVDNGLKEIIDTTTIEDQIVGKGWTQKETNGNKTIFAYYQPVVHNKDADQKFIVFENFKLKGDADVSGYGTAKITVKACAVQADGLTEAAALNEAKAKFTP